MMQSNNVISTIGVVVSVTGGLCQSPIICFTLAAISLSCAYIIWKRNKNLFNASCQGIAALGFIPQVGVPLGILSFFLWMAGLEEGSQQK